jgi:hypothetical protein
MIERSERPVTSPLSLVHEKQERDFLSQKSVSLLWPDREAHRHTWEAFGQDMAQIGDTYAKVSIERALYYEEQACERYQSACQYYQRKFYCVAATWLGKTMCSIARALRRWGYTAIWLKHIRGAEDMPSSSRNTISRILLEVSQQQHWLCTVLYHLQRTYLAYCFHYALIPSLFEDEREEEHQ